MLKTKITIFLIIIIVFIFAFKVIGNQDDGVCLKNSYEYYKNNFMSKDGRIIDFSRNNITTSEGQSYMLLRSLIIDDKKTFDLVWEWTKNNLQRNDKLFAWAWGENPRGEYTVLDDNSASDADIDIAFALILAYEKWKNGQYLDEALQVVRAVWDEETKQIGNYLVLMPGYKQTFAEKIEINPSYFSPYAFRYFQKYDQYHDWGMLIESSYYYLNEVTCKTKTGLPPDWFLIQDGQIVLADSSKSDFSYDAIRVFGRLYLDYTETGEKKALAILKKSNFFVEKWNEDKKLYTNYQSNGELRDNVRFTGSIAVLVPAISIYDSKTADEIYAKELKYKFIDDKFWNNNNDYYDKNLSWFGYYAYKKNINGCKIKNE